MYKSKVTNENLFTTGLYNVSKLLLIYENSEHLSLLQNYIGTKGDRTGISS